MIKTCPKCGAVIEIKDSCICPKCNEVVQSIIKTHYPIKIETNGIKTISQ